MVANLPTGRRLRPGASRLYGALRANAISVLGTKLGRFWFDFSDPQIKVPYSGELSPPAGDVDSNGNGVDSDDCSNDCVPKSCGDGVVQPPEECDDANMVDEDNCTSGCKLAACHDGFQQMGEACDDGNMDNTDACVGDCAVATCGDGFTQADAEACDDGNQVNTDDCTTACQAAACGDGFTQQGEACDDGNQVNTDACTTMCAAAACGDGFIQANVEECDDGNMIDTDVCTKSCKDATCGDGIVYKGMEECDDGNVTNDDKCSNACKYNPRRVFVSSVEYVGNLGGVTGADQKCQSLAQGAGLPGTWLAWVSADTDATSPSMRFTKSTFGYILVDGTYVANNWGDLTDGSLAHAIDRQENGQTPGNENDVWSNTTPAGTSKGNMNHCSAWTSGSSQQKGFLGLWPATNGGWSEQPNGPNNPSACDNDQRILCFQQ